MKLSKLESKMKLTATILIAVILIIGNGFIPVEATSSSSAPSAPATCVCNELIDGVRTLLTSGISTLFTVINNLLLLVFTSFVSLLTTALPADTSIQLTQITPPLLALKDPTLLSVATAVLKLFKIKESIVLKLGPIPLLYTPIDIKLLLKQAAPFVKGGKLTFGDLIQILINYLVTVYSCVLPKVK